MNVPSDGLINRYYDPTTDQFISVDPAVAQTDQPYVFVYDNPLNAEDPLGQLGFPCHGVIISGHGCVVEQKLSKSRTLKAFENALKSSKSFNALDLSGAAITSIA